MFTNVSIITFIVFLVIVVYIISVVLILEILRDIVDLRIVLKHYPLQRRLLLVTAAILAPITLSLLVVIGIIWFFIIALQYISVSLRDLW